MTARRFALLIGCGVGALAIALARRHRARAAEVSPHDLAESLRDLLAMLEQKAESSIRRRS